MWLNNEMSPNKYIIYHESIHLIISTIIAFVLWKIYPYPPVVITAILSGVLIDSDHLFDLIFGYIKNVDGAFSLNKLSAFFYGNYMRIADKIYIPLHSLEFVWVWWFIGYFLNSLFAARGLEWAFLIPILVHILVDYAVYTPHPLAYFFFFRLLHKFSRNCYHGKSHSD